jgi:hypothetical protein
MVRGGIVVPARTRMSAEWSAPWRGPGGGTAWDGSATGTAEPLLETGALAVVAAVALVEAEPAWVAGWSALQPATTTAAAARQAASSVRTIDSPPGGFPPGATAYGGPRGSQPRREMGTMER